MTHVKLQKLTSLTQVRVNNTEFLVVNFLAHHWPWRHCCFDPAMDRTCLSLPVWRHRGTITLQHSGRSLWRCGRGPRLLTAVWILGI